MKISKVSQNIVPVSKSKASSSLFYIFTWSWCKWLSLQSVGSKVKQPVPGSQSAAWRWASSRWTRPWLCTSSLYKVPEFVPVDICTPQTVVNRISVPGLLSCTRRWSCSVPLSSLMHNVFSHILLVFITWLWFVHWLLTLLLFHSLFLVFLERQLQFSADLGLPDSPRSCADRVGHSCDLKCSLLSFSLSS